MVDTKVSTIILSVQFTPHLFRYRFFASIKATVNYNLYLRLQELPHIYIRLQKQNPSDLHPGFAFNSCANC